MAKFDYSESQADAFELISEFGANALVLVVQGEYDPVSGNVEDLEFSATEAKAVNLPVSGFSRGFGVSGDTQFQADMKAGRIKGFYISSQDLSFNPQPGSLMVWQSKVWDIAAVGELNPAGVAVFFSLGCRESSKFDWQTLLPLLEIANDYFEQ